MPPEKGAKLTLIVHGVCAAKLLPQLLVWVNIPPTVMLAMFSGAFPVLLSVTGCGVLGALDHWVVKFSDVGETTACGAESAPKPVRLALWGLSGALS
jgi:hypothetical protein